LDNNKDVINYNYLEVSLLITSHFTRQLSHGLETG